MRAAGIAVLLDRLDAIGRRSRDRLAFVEDRVGHLRLRRKATALLHRVGDRPDLVLCQVGEVEQRVGGTLDVLDLVRQVHAGDLTRAVASSLAVLVDRRDNRAADVDVRRDVLARVTDEGGRGDRRRQATVGNLARERLHLRRRRCHVDGWHLTRGVSFVAKRRHCSAPGVAVVLEGIAAEHASYDRHRVAHGSERLRRLRLDVVQEDLRRTEPKEESTWSCGLLHDPGVHRHLHGMPRERRDDPPADRQALRLARDEHGHDRGRTRLHCVLSPPRVRLGEPDRVHPGLVHDPRRLEHLLERLHRELHDPDAERRRHRRSQTRRRGIGSR